MSFESKSGGKFLLSLALALGLLCYGTLAQAEVWQNVVDDTRLTSASKSSGSPGLGVDNADNIHITWEDNRDSSYEIYYTKLNNNGNTVVDDTRLSSADSASSVYPSLGVDGSDNIHIAWEDSRAGGFLPNSEIHYTKRDSNGTTVVDDTRLTSESASSGSPGLGVDNADNIHIAWQDSRDGFMNSEIYYTKLDNNGNMVVDDTKLSSASASSISPSLGVDNTDNVHIAWQDERNGGTEIYYTKLDNNGNTVVDDTRLTSDSGSSMSPSLGVDSSGYIHIAWSDNRDGNYEIYYTKLDESNGNTLVDDTRLTSDSGSSMSPSLGVDSSGYIHIAWSDNRDGSYEIYYTNLNNNGSTLVDDTRLTPADGSNSISPSLGMDSSSYIHIAWSDNRDGNAEIYYTKGSTVAPSEDGGGGGGGCFIATAAYGTPLAKEVRILSHFRDTHLLSNPQGQKLVSFYYKISPPIASYIKDNDYLKAAVRSMLKPVVWLIQNFFIEDGKGKEGAPIVKPAP